MGIIYFGMVFFVQMVTRATMINAKRAFVLADKLKRGPFDTREAFLDSMKRLSEEIASLDASDIDSLVGRDQRRLNHYNQANWAFEGLDLNTCHVWPRMGNRVWAEGCVFDVAQKFKTQEPQASRIWDMRQFADIFSERLPIIVLNTTTGLRIDDGSHRAIAMALAGITRVSAWIGKHQRI